MKRILTILLSLLATLIIGIVIGMGAMLIAYPYIFPPPVLNEKVVHVASKKVFSIGTFIHPNPSDPIHYGKGNVSIYRSNTNQYEVFLHDNFLVGPGPAFHVYLVENKDIKDNRDFKKAVKYDLGMLKSFRGSQVYKIPEHINMKDIQSVVVWCKSFSQLITSANLNHGEKASKH